MLGVSFASAQSTTGAAPTPPVPVIKNQPALPPLPADLQALVDQFKTQRTAIMAASKALLDALKAAPDSAARKALLDAFKAQNADLITQQRDLAKTLRDDMRALRKTKTPGGG